MKNYRMKRLDAKDQNSKSYVVLYIHEDEKSGEKIQLIVDQLQKVNLNITKQRRKSQGLTVWASQKTKQYRKKRQDIFDYACISHQQSLREKNE